MEALGSLFVRSIFIENMVFAYFFGMCSYLAVSKTVKTAVGLGAAVIFVLTITVPVNYLLDTYILRDGALAWMGPGYESIDLSFLSFIMFIAVIAAMVQAIEIIIDRFSAALYAGLGVFLPLIAVNCAILGTSLFMVERNHTFMESLIFGFGSGVGWMMAIISMAAIRIKLRYANPPYGMEGYPLTMIVTGLMAMAFMLFSGIAF